MKSYFEMNKQEITNEYRSILSAYESFKQRGLKLDMARGKPSAQQLELSNEMLDVLNSSSDFKIKNGVDVRNYGLCDGISEMKEFISKLTGIDKQNFIIGGNSSLSMMYDAISFFMTHGANGCKPWLKQNKIKFLCPSPGYDRHFAICEYFGMELISVPITESGPDMDIIENIVSQDETVKGIWCVPKYSNPSGVTCSDETVKRFAKLKPLAKDFRIFWDNAYFLHDLTPDGTKLLNIIDECVKYENQHLPIVFYSTSKITFPGAGVAFMVCVGENIENFRKMYSVKTVGFDKINQLRHLRFLKDEQTIKKHMQKHCEILKPKFLAVVNKLKEEFLDNPILDWNEPLGGYFVSVNTLPGFAKRVVELCKSAGVILTSAGATYPYGNDPKDSNIRLAPTYPALSELNLAMQLFCICVKLAFLEKNI